MGFPRGSGPIIACATGTRAPCALALIRLSGFSTWKRVGKFFPRSGPMEPCRAYPVRLIDPDTGESVDHVIATYFEAPGSYTGENVLELSVHGNPLNVDRIIALFCRKGFFSLALPGEFTYRAVLNKKMTLSQAEGLDLLLNASSGFALSQGLRVLDGDIQETFLELRDSFIRLKSAVELSIDFADDVGEEEIKAQIRKGLGRCLAITKRLAGSSVGGDLVRPRVCLAGPTNAGKSTLFNAIVGKSRSIVSDVEGTTRDYVGESVTFGGVGYEVTDTAGLRADSHDRIEREGMERTGRLLKKSFFRILVLHPGRDCGDGFADADWDLIVCTHADKKPRISESVLRFAGGAKVLWTGFGPIGAEAFGPIGPLAQGGPIGAGVPIADVLFGEISNKFNELAAENPLLIERHGNIVREIHEDLSRLERLLADRGDVAVLASEVGMAALKADALIGVVAPEDVLDSLFANFCIGK